MKHSKFLLTAAFLAAFFQTSAQDLLLRKAPPIKLKTMLQAPQRQLPTAGLAGKVVVLEFWATWCHPCMANVPHLNALQQHFADSNVVFLSVTDEEENKVSAFLQKRKLMGWIGIDSNDATNKNYGIASWPATFVIDAAGVIVYAGHPEELTEQVISGILRGTYEPAVKKAEPEEAPLGNWGGGDDPVYTAHFSQKPLSVQTIRPSVMSGFGGTGFNQGGGRLGITLLGLNLPSVVSYIDELPSPIRVLNLSHVKDNLLWDVIFYRNKGCDMPKALHDLSLLVEETFSMTIKDTTVLTDVLVASYSNSSTIMNEKNINFNAPEANMYHPLKELFDRLENKTGQIIDYPTDAANNYIDLFPVLKAYYKMNGGELKAWLEEEGVMFLEERKMVKMEVLRDSEQL